ncbi:MAG: beta propeller repeat protein [Ferrimicrobium sp.]
MQILSGRRRSEALALSILVVLLVLGIVVTLAQSSHAPSTSPTDPSMHLISTRSLGNPATGYMPLLCDGSTCLVSRSNPGAVLYSTDRGRTFSTSNLTEFAQAGSCRSENTCYVVAQNQLYLTRNAGAVWSPVSLVPSFFPSSVFCTTLSCIVGGMARIGESPVIEVVGPQGPQSVSIHAPKGTITSLSCSSATCVAVETVFSNTTRAQPDSELTGSPSAGFSLAQTQAPVLSVSCSTMRCYGLYGTLYGANPIVQSIGAHAVVIPSPLQYGKVSFAGCGDKGCVFLDTTKSASKYYQISGTDSLQTLNVPGILGSLGATMSCSGTSCLAVPGSFYYSGELDMLTVKPTGLSVSYSTWLGTRQVPTNAISCAKGRCLLAVLEHDSITIETGGPRMRDIAQLPLGSYYPISMSCTTSCYLLEVNRNTLVDARVLVIHDGAVVRQIPAAISGAGATLSCSSTCFLDAYKGSVYPGTPLAILEGGRFIDVHLRRQLGDVTLQSVACHGNLCTGLGYQWTSPGALHPLVAQSSDAGLRWTRDKAFTKLFSSISYDQMSTSLACPSTNTCVGLVAGGESPTYLIAGDPRTGTWTRRLIHLSGSGYATINANISCEPSRSGTCVATLDQTSTAYRSISDRIVLLGTDSHLETTRVRSTLYQPGTYLLGAGISGHNQFDVVLNTTLETITLHPSA